MKRIGGVVTSTVRSLTKRAGLSIYRPVLNADKWAAWMKEAGVPNAKAAADLKVNVLQAIGGAIAVVPDRDILNIRAVSGVFMSHGVNGLAFAWYDYYYNDRHWALRELAGCEVSCVHRNLLVLSDDIGDFELTDDMLLKAPVSIVLDGEQTATITDTDIDLIKSAASGEDLVKAKDVESAVGLLVSSYEDPDFNPVLQSALYDLSKGRSVARDDLDGLDDEDMKVLGLEKNVPDRERQVEKAKEPAPAPAPAKVEKAKDLSPNEGRMIRKDKSLQTVYGFASVAVTADGDTVTDWHGHEITTDAQRDLLWGLVKGQRQGNIDHDEDDMSGELVEGIVFTKELWQALEPYTGQEGLFIGMHFPKAEDYDKTADKGMFSIGCRGTVEEIEVPDELEET
ncbi:hypothetical protein CPT_Sansa24 [Caulobacter phage Sansa]|uniref:Uncharacterized protein n=1 Tax=Caulobacter phage Sansa TaxID=1675600 RepID=A0A0K1LML5_9CAUD|nr:hypothetical protein HOR07_gp024 [Caulobacter phage Sansa]AKU43428.1 hypothetical protein CPT_Sansa24 [Caulobacter phage Sansa]